MNVMMHDVHIYVLNHNLKSSAHELEKHTNAKIVSNIYSVRYDDDDEDVEYKMFDTIGDILNILKQYVDIEKYYLIHRDNYLDKIYFDLVDAGYAPTTRFDAGQLCSLTVKLNKKLFSSFLSYVLEENPYVEIYKEYFFSIIRNYDEIESIKKIGLIIIENAIGIYHAKLRKKHYMEHFRKFYIENLIEKIEQNSSHFSFALGNDNSFYSNFNNENKDPNTQMSLYIKKPFSAELNNYSKLSIDELKISIANK